MPSAARPRPVPMRRGAQREAHGDQPEADRQRQVGDPGRHAFGDGAAGLAIDVEERDAAERQDRRDHRADGAGDDVRGGADPALRQELAGRERQQLAFAGGDRRPEHAEPEREVRRERGRPLNRPAEELARDDLGERQQHDPRERQAREAILGLDRECLYRHGMMLTRLADGPHLTCLSSSGRHHAPERPRRRCRPAPCRRAWS